MKSNLDGDSLIQKMAFDDTELGENDGLVQTAMKISKTFEQMSLYATTTSEESSNESLMSYGSEELIINKIKTRMSFQTTSEKCKIKKIKVILNIILLYVL